MSKVEAVKLDIANIRWMCMRMFSAAEGVCQKRET